MNHGEEVEANPVMYWLFQTIGLEQTIFLKTFLFPIVVLIFILKINEPPDAPLKPENIMINIVLGIYIFVCINNITHIILHL